MTVKAIFVGINKHLDVDVPELSGARRDATALWALFTDTRAFAEYLFDRVVDRVVSFGELVGLARGKAQRNEGLRGRQ